MDKIRVKVHSLLKKTENTLANQIRTGKICLAENFESVRNADDFFVNDKNSEVQFLGTQSTIGPVKSHICSASLSSMPFIDIEEHEVHHKALSQKALRQKSLCFYSFSQNVQVSQLSSHFFCDDTEISGRRDKDIASTIGDGVSATDRG
ncbi:hypothetical protein MMC22_003667 [Lobaria immixta]|nr:hypothetical protein [Lobaria immixta]